MATDNVRIERDSLGEVRVPAAALYAAQTQRAVENFPVSGLEWEAESAGDKMLMPKTSIGEHGLGGSFLDAEGNHPGYTRQASDPAGRQGFASGMTPCCGGSRPTG